MSFFVSQGFASEASLSAPHDLQKHQKLIRFLQIARAANVGFMPLTWTKDFEQLGSGTSAAVTQTALSSQTSLAFKRFNLVRGDGTSGAGERLDAQYDDMATELRTLALPGMKSHPNIINLVGVCFEIAPSSDDVLPVLVLERADLTSMAWLMYELPMITSEEDVVLPPSLEVCFEVAKALSMLHQHGIVHCDIKPANVLINRDIVPGHVQVKLGDFAFSRSNLPEESPFKVSRTEPWEAPEWHQRYFTFESAKKMDIYSFGLLCLWSFFKNDTLEEVGEDATVGGAFSGHFPSQTAKLQSLKKDGVAFLKCAARLVEQSRDLDEETRSRLSKLFPLILASDPETRAPDIDVAVDILRVDPCIPETLE